jgi:hypothetical protein
MELNPTVPGIPSFLQKVDEESYYEKESIGN